MNDVTRHAWLSDDGLYRYMLLHVWDRYTFPICWIMLNPSTADAKQDDATIRCVTFWSRKLGAGAFMVVNLFALRSTDPKALFGALDPIGPRNHEFVRAALNTCPMVVCAWGATSVPEVGAAESVLEQLRADQGTVVLCLGKTKDGRPRHPLYVKRSTVPEPFL